MAPRMIRRALSCVLSGSVLIASVWGGGRAAQATSFPVTSNCTPETCKEFGPVPLGGGTIPIMVWGTGKRGVIDNPISIQRRAKGSSSWSSWGGITSWNDPLMPSAVGPEVMFTGTVGAFPNKAQMSYAVVGPFDQSFDYRVTVYPGKNARRNIQPWRFVSGSGPTFRADDVFDFAPPAGTLRQWIRRLGCNGCDLQRWDGTAWVATKRTSLVPGDLFAFQRSDGRWLRAMVPGGT